MENDDLGAAARQRHHDPDGAAARDRRGIARHDARLHAHGELQNHIPSRQVTELDPEG